MPQKKKLKKTPTKTKKLGRDPTLKPTVVDTSHMANKEEQADNPLNRKQLPEGFKTADTVTEVDDLKFELGRLREMLVSWLDRVVIDGVAYQIMIDPLNRAVLINHEL